MLEPPWAQSAVLLEKSDLLRRANGNEAFACPVCRDRAHRSQDHHIGSREFGPFFEILQPVVHPLAPRPVWLGFRPSCLGPKRGFPPGPWFLLLPAPMAIWQAGNARTWLQGKDAKGVRPAWGRVPAVSLALTLGKSPNRSESPVPLLLVEGRGEA